jgi:hypothetical protein
MGAGNVLISAAGYVIPVGKAVVAGGALIAISADAYKLYNNSSVLSPNIMFPSDLQNTYMQFRFVEYKKPSIYDEPIGKFKNGLILPIPNNLSIDISVSYQDAELGPAVGAAVEKLNFDKMSSQSDIFNSVISAGKSGIEGAGLGVLGDSKIGPGVSYLTGLSVNPYLAVLFKNPNFRQHSFSWKLIAKNETESNTIKQIVNTFQFNMLPGILPDNNSLLFKYPNVIEIALSVNGNQADYLYSFKKCVIKDFKVNYTPGGAPSFFNRTGAPTVDITVSLQEIEMWNQNDINTQGQNITTSGSALPDNQNPGVGGAGGFT